MNIKDKSVVSFHYTLTGDDGKILDSSEGKDPLSYLHGSKNIVPGLEKALVGKTVGDNVKVAVSPDEGYGEYDSALIQKVPPNAFQGVDQIDVGMQFHAQDPQGNVQVITVTEVSDNEITVDGNHPLAGETLNFDVTIEKIRAASEEELDHGHPH